MADPKPRLDRWRDQIRDQPVLAPILGLAAVLMLAAGVVAAVKTLVDTGRSVSKDPPPPSIEQQLSEIRHRAALDHARPVLDQRLDLNTGTSSFLLVFRNEAVARFAADASVSDDIRIYQQDHGRLRLAFRFQPKALTEPGLKLGFPYVFRLTTIKDIDGNGRREVIGTVGVFSPTGSGFHQPLPVVMAWDDGKRVFNISALLTHRPHVARVRNPGAFGRHVTYTRSLEVVDDRAGGTVRGYSMEGFGILKRRDAEPLIVGGFIVRAASDAGAKVYQALAWALDLTTPTPRTFDCIGKRVFVRPRRGRALGTEFVRAWAHTTGGGMLTTETPADQRRRSACWRTLPVT